MKIVIAPDSFKESLSAIAVAEAIAEGFRRAMPNADCHCLPMADGGEGTTETILALSGGEWREVQVQNPLGETITARYARLSQQRAVLEMASTSGLTLLNEVQRNPLYTHTYGVGQMILDALDQTLARYAEKLIQAGFTDHRQSAGSGAAGGLGFALLGLPNSRMLPGIDLVMALADLETACRDADLVITGEGRMDGQTLSGKVPMGVLRLAKRHNVPTIALCGCLGKDSELLNAAGFSAIFPIIPHLDSLKNTLKNGATNLSRSAKQVARLIATFYDR